MVSISIITASNLFSRAVGSVFVGQDNPSSTDDGIFGGMKYLLGKSYIETVSTFSLQMWIWL